MKRVLIATIVVCLAGLTYMCTKVEEIYTCGDRNGDGIENELDCIGRDGLDGKDGIDGKDGKDGQDGSDGFSVVTKISSAPQCENGGYVIKFGLDINRNGVLDDREPVQNEVVICHTIDGFNTIFETIPVLPEDTDTCPGGQGGWTIWYGRDINRNNILEYEERENAFTICNGQAGADGEDGQNGSDGADGRDGTDGSDGTDGVDAPVNYFVKEIIRDSTTIGCKGVRVDVYDDVDADGQLNKEIDFFLEGHTLCYGMTVGQALAIGYELDDFFDVDIDITEGNNSCPDNPRAVTVVVTLDGEELITFIICPTQ